MTDTQGEIVVVGAGGIGGTVAAALTLAGNRVTVVDNSPEHIERIRENGLLFDGVQGDRHVHFARALLPDEWTTPADIVLLGVKSYDTGSALEILAPRLSEEGVVVSFQNGWNGEKIAKLIGRERTMPAMVHLVANYVGHGHVTRFTEGDLYVGEMDPVLSQRAEQLALRMSAAGIPTHATGNVWGYIWSKQIYGTTMPANALVDVLAREQCKLEWVKYIQLALILEGIQVADAEGVALEPYERMDPMVMRLGSPSDLAAAMAMLPKGSAKGNSGVWHDIKIRHRKTEVEHLTGELVRIGRKHGLPMRTNQRVVEMIGEIETGRRPMAWENLRELEAPARAFLNEALGLTHVSA